MRVIVVIFAWLSFVSCKPTQIAGTYILQDVPETNLKLNNNGTYEFTRKNQNPYLHPSYRPEHNFFITYGKWQQADKKLILNDLDLGQSAKKPELFEEKEVDSLRYPTITFYDVSGNPATIFYLKFPDQTQIQTFGKPSSTMPWTSNNSDTVEFFIYGYHPFTYIRPDKKKRHLKFRIYPQVRTDFFKEKEFTIGKNELVDGEHIFRKIKAN